ncbi:MAG TPA: VanZ family protein [Sediminibacterium sp.]
MKIIRFLPTIGWFILSIILLTLPGSAVPSYPWLATIHADKWVHIGLFGMLCLLSMLPFRASSYNNKQRKKWFLLITFGGILYGILMEFVQENWVINRSFEYSDILADTAGCVLAYYISLRKFLVKG